MCFNNEKNNFCCCILTILSALIASSGIAAVYYAGFLTSITNIIIITLILGVLGLLYTIITNICGEKNCKTIENLCAFPIIVGSILVPIFTLFTTELAIGSISVGLLILANVFFLTLSLINFLKILFSFICPSICRDI